MLNSAYLERLKRFQFDRVLNEDLFTKSLAVLGTLPSIDSTEETVPAILRLERSALPTGTIATLIPDNLDNLEVIDDNDIYSWFHAWLKTSHDRSDLKIYVIAPATEVHIRKYTKQELVMVQETPALYEEVVKPYINAFPTSRTQWVDDILSGKYEAEKVLYEEPSSESGFVILPDMKWDMKTVSTLYLLAIARSPHIKSLRDLRREHLPMLRSIRREAVRIVQEKWGLGRGSTRLFIHYQPSYYHFHVHIVRSNENGFLGMAVGQAHLLDDVISLLELDSEGPSILEKMSFTYGLGDQHGLYEPLRRAQAN